MESLGSRIRALRKQQGKTLADLAGERLTKGMLSLIENDKAQLQWKACTILPKRSV